MYTLACWETGLFVAKHGTALYKVDQMERRKVGSGKTDRPESLSVLHPHRSVGMKEKKPANAKDCRWTSGAWCPTKTATLSCNWIIWAIVCGSPKVIMLGREAFRMSFIKENMAGYNNELMPLSDSFFFFSSLIEMYKLWKAPRMWGGQDCSAGDWFPKHSR